MTEPLRTGDWPRIEAVLGDALARTGMAREAFLDEACSGDMALRHEVTSLLAAHEHSGALDGLAADIAPFAAGLRSGGASAGDQRSDGKVSALVGRTIEQYRIVSHVGHGGMGVVYEAVDTRLDRTVALKFLPPHLTNDRHARRRFEVEARAAAALDHPNICTMYAIGTTDGDERFLVMPLYVGETLHERIARGPLAVADAVTIAVQIARGLATAHDAGIVHRDVKPSNLFITQDGVVKILDFGIAKLVDQPFAQSGPGLLGTLAYMSPEQALGNRIDAGTDIWAVGVVLYEMLTGARPFGASGAAILSRIAHAEPTAIFTYRTDLPPALDALVRRALSKRREHRQASAHELECELLSLGVAADGVAPIGQSGDGLRRRRASSRGARRVLIGGAGALVALAAITGIMIDGRSNEPATRAALPMWTDARVAADAPAPSIVVLPFVSLAAGKENEFLSDGLTEEVITRLAAVPALKVISRTSAMHYKNSSATMREIASRLHVAHVLEGSVRRSGDRLRITVQLIDARTDVHRWGASFDMEPSDPFAVQEQIARQVVSALEVALGETGRRQLTRRGTIDATAYDLYRRGRFHWSRRTRDDQERAIAFFQQAIARDALYADAHAGLADAYLTSYHFGFAGVPEPVSFERHKRAAVRALSLDAESAEAHASMATSMLWQRDWPAAEREFERALSLNPGNSVARTWYSLVLAATGRIADARREARLAAELDPFAMANLLNVGWACTLEHDHRCAIDYYRRATELNPSFGNAVRSLAIAYSLAGQHGLAVSTMNRAITLDACTDCQADLALLYARSGERDTARALLLRAQNADILPLRFAVAWLAVGDRERAAEWLERTDWRWPHRAVRSDPMLDPVRSDPRFLAISARVDTLMRLTR